MKLGHHPEIDGLLSPLLRVDEASSHRLIERLIAEHAGPVVKQVIRTKLGGQSARLAMIVISDTTPLRYLIEIEEIDCPKVFVALKTIAHHDEARPIKWMPVLFAAQHFQRRRAQRLRRAELWLRI